MAPPSAPCPVRMDSRPRLIPPPLGARNSWRLGPGAGRRRSDAGRIRGKGRRPPLARPRPRRDHQAGGQERGQPPHVAPSHPAEEAGRAVSSPPSHADLRRVVRGFAPRPHGAPLLSSAAVPRLYDLMLLLDPNAPEERQNEVIRNVESMIETDATLVGKHDWGIRRIAFQIDHRPEAAYHLFQ